MQGQCRDYLTEGERTAICRSIRNCLPKERIVSEVLDLKEEGVFFFGCKIFHGQGNIDRISKHFSNRVQASFLHDRIVIVIKSSSRPDSKHCGTP